MFYVSYFMNGLFQRFDKYQYLDNYNIYAVFFKGYYLYNKYKYVSGYRMYMLFLGLDYNNPTDHVGIKIDSYT